MTLLRFEEVALARGGRVLADALSFALAPGEALMVTGPNGAGKSSLIRVAAGLLAPAAGVVRREGRVALLGEPAALDGESRLGDALRFWARLDAARAATVAEALTAVGLTALGEVPVRMLSTGQRRRAALARVVTSGAALWLLDEPANGLDVASVGVLERLIVAHRAGGGAVVVATHLPLQMADAKALFLPGARRGPADVGDWAPAFAGEGPTT